MTMHSSAELESMLRDEIDRHSVTRIERDRFATMYTAEKDGLAHARIEELERLVTRLAAAARPIADYYEKLAKWDGGCALPPEPTAGQRLDFVNAFRGAR